MLLFTVPLVSDLLEDLGVILAFIEGPLTPVSPSRNSGEVAARLIAKAKTKP